MASDVDHAPEKLLRWQDIRTDNFAADSMMRTRVGRDGNVYWTPINLISPATGQPRRTVCHVVREKNETDNQHYDRVRRLMWIIEAGYLSEKAAKAEKAEQR